MTTISVYKGETQRINISVKLSGSATDITGGSVFFYVKKNPHQSTLAINKTAVMDTPSVGTCYVDLTSTNTSIEPGDYSYETRYVDSSGSKHPLSGPNKFIVLNSLNVPD